MGIAKVILCTRDFSRKYNLNWRYYTGKNLLVKVLAKAEHKTFTTIVTNRQQIHNQQNDTIRERFQNKGRNYNG
jgi:hypothetical protein